MSITDISSQEIQTVQIYEVIETNWKIIMFETRTRIYVGMTYITCNFFKGGEQVGQQLSIYDKFGARKISLWFTLKSHDLHKANWKAR